MIVSEVDNPESIKMAKNQSNGNRTEHIDLNYNLVSDLYRQKKFDFEYCLTTDMVVNILTILLERHCLRSSASNLDYNRNENMQPSNRGGC